MTQTSTVARKILRLGFSPLPKRGDAIESDIGEHRNRGAVEHATDGESLRVVERLQKICLGILRQMEKVPDSVPEKCHDHGAHDRTQDLIDARRSLHPAQV